MDEETDRFPLHTAARLGQVSRAEALLKARFTAPFLFAVVVVVHNDPKLARKQDDDGRYAVHWAASSNSFDIVLMLADLPGFDPDVQTALHFVASKKNMDVARLLLVAAKPPASTRVRDRRGQYAVHRAAAAGSVPMVLLLLRNRSPLNPTDGEGFTPLHHAVAEGHGDVAVALLKEGADFTIRNSADELALDLAPDKEVRAARHHHAWE
ncbi:putative ankyrin-repeat protein [Purpureocillium takamizusanense]|uniref:Ankyrin-repeat protein n=1 Tax=Purpureocillium takamizusanense TaxID=2060973 RepID=A0A9Q8V7Y4_9HYPO|nr:putative ankyrin-repeat protein [Purpureocillium takamizusanense]UNI15242.1 putative ankyrin-repeat protein [Purpureocillium takamizusanense]